ncbi:MAG: LCP family protein [Acutalibacteraceae bacterium]|nr:LCP family protein [Acutalibacteraceae bacterium]
MSPNKNYYSASEKDGKIKAMRIILCILLAAVIVAGGIYTFMYVKNIEKEHALSGKTAQTQAYNVNLLICVRDEDNDDIDPQFLLIGFDGESKTITVSEIPTGFKLIGTEKTDTALNLFNYGSARYLRDALVNNFGINVQRFISLKLSEVETFVDKLGGVDYEIKAKMQFKNKEGNLVTNLVKGKQKLNGNQFCQYIRYDNWKNNAEKREKRVDLLVALLNEHCAELDGDTILSIYKSISNNLETDVSIVEVNDFGLQFNTLFKRENPAIRADIDFSDSQTANEQIQKYYK